MVLNSPIPHSLCSEARKAAKILEEFTIPSPKAGPDKIIPGIFNRPLVCIWYENILKAYEVFKF